MRTTILPFAIILSTLPLQAQWAYDWVQQSTSANVENGTNCAVTPDGHVAVTGTFTTNVQVGGFNEDGAPGNGTRGFVAYYDAGSAFQWAHVFSSIHQSGANCQAWDAAIDGDGNVLVAGQFNDSLLIDGSTALHAPDDALPNARVYYAAKFTSEGVLLWAGAAAVEGFTGFLYAIAVDGVGDVYLTGQGGNQYGHLIKLDGSNGEVLFDLSPNGAGAVIGDVAIDGNDNVYITGQAGNEFTMGGLTCPYNNALGGGSTPFFVGKFNSAGAAQWFYVPDQTGSGYFSFPEGNIAVAADGNCFVETRKRIRIDGDTMNDGNGSTRALIALDPQGDVRWARSLNANGQLAVNDMRCDSQGDVMLVGQTYGPTIDLLDTVISSSTNNFNVFLARYEGSTGALDALLNGPAVTKAMGIGLDADDTPTICGTFSGPVTMGIQTLIGPWNMFVTRLGPIPTGIHNAARAPALHLMPNPTDGLFMLQFPDASDRNIAVMDALGRPVWRTRSANTTFTLDASAWAKGVYHVVVQQHGERLQYPLVVR